MEQIPMQPTPVVLSAVPPPPASPRGKWYFAMLVLFMIGIGMGYVVKTILPEQLEGDTDVHDRETAMEVALPPDAVQIQACSDHRGTLYVQPKNIPVGPVYMVHEGKVIGVEYMLSKEEFLAGKSFKYLSGSGAHVDHVNIGLLSEGHEGYPIPHFHVDMYTVPKSTEDAIVCPKSATALQPTASASAESATPTP